MSTQKRVTGQHLTVTAFRQITVPGYRIECGCLLIRIRFRSAGAVYHIPVYDTEVSPYAPVFVEDCIVGSYTAECQSFEQCGQYPLSPQIFIRQIFSAFSLSTIFSVLSRNPLASSSVPFLSFVSVHSFFSSNPFFQHESRRLSFSFFFRQYQHFRGWYLLLYT